MSDFSKWSWKDREKFLGDAAEAVFTETVGKSGCVKYGLDRPPIHIGKLPQFIRFTPDFLQEHRAVEVLGVGKDETVKIKVNKVLALMKWNEYVPVFVYIYSSHRSAWCLIPIESFWQLLHTHGSVNAFPEGPLAWYISVSDLGVLWHEK